MTRFTITMNEALDFILKATETGNGSEIFIPKLKSYEMSTLIETLMELFGETKQEITGIRPGERTAGSGSSTADIGAGVSAATGRQTGFVEQAR